MVEAPKPAWRWPPAIMSMSDLFAAMRAGFDLHVEYAESGNSIYRMSRDGIAAPLFILQQTIAHRAFRIGRFDLGATLPDGTRRLTLKAKARRVRA